MVDQHLKKQVSHLQTLLPVCWPHAKNSEAVGLENHTVEKVRMPSTTLRKDPSRVGRNSELPIHYYQLFVTTKFYYCSCHYPNQHNSVASCSQEGCLSSRFLHMLPTGRWRMGQKVEMDLLPESLLLKQVSWED